MRIAFDVNQVSEYILEADKKDPNPTVFLTGVLDSALAAQLLDNSGRVIIDDAQGQRTANIKVNQAVRNRQIVKFGLRGWKHFKLPNGQDAVCDVQEVDVPEIGKRPALTDASLNLVKPWIAELAKKIGEDNTVTKDDEKNSQPSSKS